MSIDFTTIHRNRHLYVCDSIFCEKPIKYPNVLQSINRHTHIYAETEKGPQFIFKLYAKSKQKKGEENKETWSGKKKNKTKVTYFKLGPQIMLTEFITKDTFYLPFFYSC